jgi:Spy/CpxP family protein refolding chaperone
VQRSKGLAALLLIAMLLAGGAIGFAAARILYPSDPPPGGSQKYWDQIAKEWNLTPQQRSVIDSLLDVQQKKMAALYQPLIEQMDSAAVFARAISDSTQAAMRQVLNEEQRSKLDQLREETRQRAAERRARRTDWWRKVQ